MPRLKQELRASTTEVVEVKLTTKIRTMLTERLTEYARLASQVRDIKGTKKKPGRMRRIEDEVEELFRKDKQGKALVKGCRVEGFGVKRIAGQHSVFDKLGFMAKHGLTQADFDEFTTSEDNKPYIKITAPGQDDDE